MLKGALWCKGENVKKAVMQRGHYHVKQGLYCKSGAVL